MCYFLYGAINDGINISDYNKVKFHDGYHFNIGTSCGVNKCVEECGTSFRIKDEHCNCSTALGSHHINKKEIENLENSLLELRTVRGIKHIYLSKNWVNEINVKEIDTHIQDIDIKYFLANIEDNCLYRIDLYKKYY